MKFEVKLRNISPIFSAAPGAATVSLDGSINPLGGGFPLIQQRTLGVLSEDSDGETLTRSRLPIVPANTMRNLLRRTMLKHTLEQTIRDRGKLSIDAFAAAYAGSATGNPDGQPNTFDDIVTLRNHMFIGLFGGGPRMLEGKLRVENLYPIHQNAQRIIGDGYEDSAVQGYLLDIIWTRRVDPITRLLDKNDIETIEGGIESVNGWVSKLLEDSAANVKKRKKTDDSATDSDEKTGKNLRGLNAFNAHEVVIPGVPWLWRFTVDQPTSAQVGLILQALSNLDKMSVAGGHSKGYGNVVLEEATMDGKPVLQDGKLAQVAMQYLDSLAEELDTLDVSVFEQFAATKSA